MWLLLAIALVWLFSPGLLWSEIPAFRDAYYFYYPQAVWLDRCAQQGELFPLWNSSDGLGSSVAGQPSAALFYPLRLIWLTFGLSVAQRFSLFLIVHLLIAAAGMRYAAATLKLSSQAGWLAAVSYSLSCPVFFQHNNPIYLCSAAWIGFAAGAVLQSVRHPGRPWKELVIFAAACSMMLLAGDPHTAVNTLIVAACVRLAAALSSCQADVHAWQWRRGLQRTVSAGLWLLSAGLLFGALTAIQSIPAWRQAQTSARGGHADGGLADSIRAESVGAPGLEQVNEILESKRGQPLRHRVYDFSLAPWYLITAIWPTLGGDYLPQNSRLFAVLPAEGRMWVPAIYFGCLPCVLVLGGIARKKSRMGKLLLGMAILSLLAALGSYSAVWTMREIFTACGLVAWANRLPPDSTSGLYWLICTLLPAYDLFRYPAKWTVWLVAFSSLFAAMQLSRHASESITAPSQRLTRLVRIISAAGLGGALAFWVWSINSAAVDRWLATAASDAWLGSPDARAIGRSLIIAFALPLLIVSLNVPHRFYAALTLAEMTLAASCWVSFLPPPRGANSVPQTIDSFARPAADQPVENAFVWIDRSQADLLADFPNLASAIGHSQLLQAQAAYQQLYWLGKLSNLTATRCLSGAQSIESRSLVIIRSWLSRRDLMTPRQPELDAILRELGVTHRLTRKRLPSSGAEFAWQAIENPRPECEFFPSDGESSTQSEALYWQWLGSDTLEVQTANFGRGQLLVRQLNDGGWSARAASGAEIAIEPESLFILLKLDGQERSVRLSRKWLW